MLGAGFCRHLRPFVFSFRIPPPRSSRDTQSPCPTTGSHVCTVHTYIHSPTCAPLPSSAPPPPTSPNHPPRPLHPSAGADRANPPLCGTTGWGGRAQPPSRPGGRAPARPDARAVRVHAYGGKIHREHKGPARGPRNPPPTSLPSPLPRPPPARACANPRAGTSARLREGKTLVSQHAAAGGWMGGGRRLKRGAPPGKEREGGVAREAPGLQRGSSLSATLAARGCRAPSRPPPPPPPPPPLAPPPPSPHAAIGNAVSCHRRPTRAARQRHATRGAPAVGGGDGDSGGRGP